MMPILPLVAWDNVIALKKEEETTSMIKIDLQIKHHFGPGIYIKESFIPERHYVETHEHKYDHFGMLGKGRAMVELDGIADIEEGPAVIMIKAGVKHKITALTDVTWFCLHATNETDPDKVDQVLIKEG